MAGSHLDPSRVSSFAIAEIWLVFRYLRVSITNFFCRGIFGYMDLLWEEE